MNRVPHKQPEESHHFAVTLKLENIKYEVKFDTWLREDATREDNPTRNIAYKRDEAEDWLRSKIGLLIDNIYGDLSWCTREHREQLTDDVDDETQEWTIVFDMPREWRGSPRHIRSLLHKHVVAAIKAEWYGNQSMPEGEVYAIEAENAADELYYECRSDKVENEPFIL